MNLTYDEQEQIEQILEKALEREFLIQVTDGLALDRLIADGWEEEDMEKQLKLLQSRCENPVTANYFIAYMFARLLDNKSIELVGHYEDHERKIAEKLIFSSVDGELNTINLFLESHQQGHETDKQIWMEFKIKDGEQND